MLPVRNDIAYMLRHLDDWVKPTRVGKNIIVNLLDHCEIKPEPLGVICIIGTWNYPFHLLILPLVAAIAAGNTVILKPSEMAPATSELLAEWIPKIFDQSAIKIILGGIPETSCVLEQKFDKIFYTGNSTVGKIVSQAAAKHLTPVALELGGKSPVYIHSDADIKNTAKRLLWGKMINAGQTCIAPDYVLVHEAVKESLNKHFVEAYKELLGSDSQQSTDYSRIINSQHFNRLNNLLNRQSKYSPGSYIVTGGKTDEVDLYIDLTIFSDVELTDPLMEDELFGPLLPVVTVKDENEAIKIIRSRDHPLMLHVLTKSSKIAKKIIDNTISGNVIVNDFAMSMLVHDLPFGGVGGSGSGAYHGKRGFNEFSHLRSIMWRPMGAEIINEVRYPPFSTTSIQRWIVDLILVEYPPNAVETLIRRLPWSFIKIVVYAAVVVGAFFIGRIFA
ncbi:Aldehyde dehydrogenase [Nowakowskiella sp. JEL0078]|nr:Aldehyde dehydrogenase [Nowakowskiella sp. JEL0078]